jgi:hypothetical protein
LIQQTPEPPAVIITPPPEPTVIVEQLPPEVIFGPGGMGEWIPIAGMLTGVVITAMFIMGPIGKAIGAVIRHWLGGGRSAENALPSEDIDELHARLDALQKQVGELAERQDFTDRMLAQVRREKALPGASDVAG